MIYNPNRCDKLMKKPLNKFTSCVISTKVFPRTSIAFYYGIIISGLFANREKLSPFTKEFLLKNYRL